MQTKDKLYWHFAASCSLVIFVILGYIIKFYEPTVLIIDQPLQALIRHSITADKTDFLIAVTHFGSGKVIAVLTGILALILALKKYWLDGIWLLINTALIAGIGNYLMKFVFARPRPSLEHLVVETHYSFPSGHAMGSMLFYGTLIVLLPRLIKQIQLCLIIQLALGVFILLIGFSRVYLGVHYPSDIIGGYLLGGAWLLGSYPTFASQRFIWRFKGKQQ